MEKLRGYGPEQQIAAERLVW